MDEQRVPLLPPSRQTHVYYPPQGEAEEQYYVRGDASSRPVRYEYEPAARNDITQPTRRPLREEDAVEKPKPRPIPDQRDTEDVERVQVIEILPPISFTPYKGDDDREYKIKK